jgi:hypothetical protein
MRLLVACLLLFLSFGLKASGPDNIISPAEKFVLHGTVVDGQTGEKLPGVEIKILGTDQVIYTDLEGNFKIDVKVGKNAISANYISYKRKIIYFNPQPALTKPFTIILNTSEKELKLSYSSLASVA